MEKNSENLVKDIRQTILLNASIQKVWETVSTSEGIALWWMPNDFKPKVGAEFMLHSPFGPSPCKVIELTPFHRLSFSWEETWFVTFELEEVGEEKTQFTLIHSGWGKGDDVISKAGEKQSVVRERMNAGWEKIVKDDLKKCVE